MKGMETRFLWQGRVSLNRLCCVPFFGKPMKLGTYKLGSGMVKRRDRLSICLELPTLSLFCPCFVLRQFIRAVIRAILLGIRLYKGVVHVAFCPRYPLIGLAVSRKVFPLHHNE